MLHIAHIDARPRGPARVRPTKVRGLLEGLYEASVGGAAMARVGWGREPWPPGDVTDDQCLRPPQIEEFYPHSSGTLPELLRRLENAERAGPDDAQWVVFLEFAHAGQFEDIDPHLANLGEVFRQAAEAGVSPAAERNRWVTSLPPRVRPLGRLIALVETLQRRTVVGSPEPDEARRPPYHAVVLLAPSGATYQTRQVDLTALAVEDAARLDRPLIEEVLKAIGRNARGAAFRPIAELAWVPEAVRDLARSNWGERSLETVILVKVYPAIDRSVTPREVPALGTSKLDAQRKAEEFRSPEARHTFETLRNAFSPIGARDVGAVQAQENTLHILQVCRQLATFTQEGSPFVCNVLLTRGRLPELAGPSGRTRAGGLECRSYLQPGSQTPFAFSGQLIRAYAEPALSEQMVLVVDANTCQLTEVLGVWRNSGEYTRRYVLCELAGWSKGLAVHVRGSGLVEVYNELDLQLGYDGFRWSRFPYEQLTACLSAFYRANAGGTGMAIWAQEDTVRRVVGGVVSLIDRRASSILAFTTERGWRALGESSPTRPYLAPVNPDRALLLTDRNDRRPHVKYDFALGALVGLLRIDGAHVLLADGGMVAAGYQVEMPTRAAGAASNGTGTAAALRLSARFGGPDLADDPELVPGFVVKVSADRQVHIYWRGREV